MAPAPAGAGLGGLVARSLSPALLMLTVSGGPRWLTLDPREVPLGGVRDMHVLRTLPYRDLPTIGAWCFLDRFGPGPVRMRVEPHPHIGLQTVTWPLVGEVRHRDSVGSDVVVRRGQLNLMTAGAGISHSEYSVGEDAVPMDALQLWVALPDDARHGPGGFEQHDDLPRLSLTAEEGEDAVATVVLGEWAGVRSPASAFTPIVGAEIAVEPGSRVRLPLERAWEHAVLLVEGDVRVADASEAVTLERGQMQFLGDGRGAAEVSSDGGALLFLLGGEPFAEDLVMWWNFAARSHEEIVDAREEWQERGVRFGRVVAHGEEWIPAPPIPPVRLKPRRRRL